MSKVNDAMDQAREEGRDLYKNISAATSRNHAAIRADLQESAAQAERLGASLKSIAKDQQNDVKAHLEHASELLKLAATEAQSIARADDAQLREANLAMLARVRQAMQNLSCAVAAKRSAAAKQPA